jgi:hypothetical protein
MSKLSLELQNVDSKIEKPEAVSLDVLTDLVESQLGNIVGGGYSRYEAFHSSDAV